MMWPQKFFFSATLLLLIIFYPSALAASYGELFNRDFSTSYSTVSFVFSIFILILSILFLLTLWVLGLKNNRMRKHPLLSKLFTSLLIPFKENKFFYTLTYPLYLTRIGFMILMYFSFSNGIGHTFLNIFLSTIMLVWLIGIWPFKSRLTTIITILMEIVIFVYFFFLISFLANPCKNYNIKKIWGVIMILWLVIMAIVILLIVSLFSLKELL